MNFQSKGMTFKDLSIHENTIEDTTSNIVECNNAAGDFRLVTVSVALCEFPPMVDHGGASYYGHPPPPPRSTSVFLRYVCVYIYIYICIRRIIVYGMCVAGEILLRWFWHVVRLFPILEDAVF